MSFYQAGTVSVDAGSKVVTGFSTAFNQQVKPGDTLLIGAFQGVLESVESNTELTLVFAWPGDTVVKTADFVVNHTGTGWYSTKDLNESVTDLIQRFEGHISGDLPGFRSVTNLELVGGLTVSEFVGTAVELKWKNNSPTTSNVNIIRVFDVASGLMLREDRSPLPWYTYTLAMNEADNARFGNPARRRLRFDVALVEVTGFPSEFASLAVFNQPPPPLIGNIVPQSNQVFVGWSLPNFPDIAGVVAWVSPVSGFDPMTTPPSYQGLTSSFVFPLIAGQPYFIRMAAFDSFGRDELNLTAEVAVTANDNQGADFEPPATPTGFLMESFARPDGTALVTFDWQPNTEDDISVYRLRVREVGSEFTQIRTDGTHHEQIMPAGIDIEADLTAYDRQGNPSPETPIAVHTVAVDSVAPATPVNVRLFTSFVSFQLEWSANVEPDLARYDVEVTIEEGSPDIVPTMATIFNVLGDAEGQTRSFRVRAVDRSGNFSLWSAKFTDTMPQIAVGTEGLAAPVIVDVLPLPIDDDTPKTVYLSTDGRFYVQRLVQGVMAWVDNTSATLLTGEIVSEQIANLAISRDKLDLAAVDRSKIDFGAVGMTEIGAGAISTPKLRSNVITSKKLQSETILSRHLTAAVILAEHLDVGSVTAQAIETGTLIARHFTAESVSTEALQARSITAEKMTLQQVITLGAQIANAIIGDAHIDSLSATKIRAGTALLGSVTVSGTALSTIASQADDPGSRINAGLTLIDPGRIRLLGSTALSSWIFGGNGTDIDGGKIAANTITANKVTVGMRGITVSGIVFEHNKPGANQVSWTAGTITYVNDLGQVIAQPIAAGSATWSTGSLFMTYTPGAAVLETTIDPAVVGSSASVILALYRGGTDLDGSYGRTVIEGGMIKTGTITAAQANITTFTTAILTAGVIKSAMVDTADLVANSALIANIVGNTAKLNSLRAGIIVANSIEAGDIVARSISADRLVAYSITATEIAVGAITADRITAGTITADRIVLGGVDTARIQDNAVSNAASVEGNSGASVAIASGGGYVHALVFFSVSTGAAAANVNVTRNGAVLRSQTVPANTTTQLTWFIPDLVGAGTFTYQANAGNAATTVRMLLLNLKK